MVSLLFNLFKCALFSFQSSRWCSFQSCSLWIITQLGTPTSDRLHCLFFSPPSKDNIALLNEIGPLWIPKESFDGLLLGYDWLSSRTTLTLNQDHAFTVRKFITIIIRVILEPWRKNCDFGTISIVETIPNKWHFGSLFKFGIFLRKAGQRRLTLSDLICNISSAIDRNKTTLDVFLDLSKAFDTIYHQLKSCIIMVFEKLLWAHWAKGYHENRNQFLQSGSSGFNNRKSHVVFHRLNSWASPQFSLCMLMINQLSLVWLNPYYLPMILIRILIN